MIIILEFLALTFCSPVFPPLRGFWGGFYAFSLALPMTVETKMITLKDVVMLYQSLTASICLMRLRMKGDILFLGTKCLSLLAYAQENTYFFKAVTRSVELLA